MEKHTSRQGRVPDPLPDYLGELERYVVEKLRAQYTQTRGRDPRIRDWGEGLDLPERLDAFSEAVVEMVKRAAVARKLGGLVGKNAWGVALLNLDVIRTHGPRLAEELKAKLCRPVHLHALNEVLRDAFTPGDATVGQVSAILTMLRGELREAAERFRGKEKSRAQGQRNSTPQALRYVLLEAQRRGRRSLGYDEARERTAKRLGISLLNLKETTFRSAISRGRGEIFAVSGRGRRGMKLAALQNPRPATTQQP